MYLGRPLAERGVRQDASGACVSCRYARHTRRGPTPGPAGTREDASLRRSREGGGGGALESSTTDSARFCGIAAAADSRDGGASTRRVNCFVLEETGSFSFILFD